MGGCEGTGAGSAKNKIKNDIWGNSGTQQRGDGTDWGWGMEGLGCWMGKDDDNAVLQQGRNHSPLDD